MRAAEENDDVRLPITANSLQSFLDSSRSDREGSLRSSSVTLTTIESWISCSVDITHSV